MAIPGRYFYTYKLGTPAGGQDIVYLNHLQNPFTVSALIDIVSGSAEYGLEFTLDDPKTDPASYRWFYLSEVPQGQKASKLFEVKAPVTAIRLNLNSNLGEVRLTVIQSPASL